MRLNKRFFTDFLFSNLDDVDLADGGGPVDSQIPVFDDSSGKWKNKRSDAFLTLNKRIYAAPVLVEDNTQALMIRPEFEGDLEIQGSGILELMG